MNLPNTTESTVLDAMTDGIRLGARIWLALCAHTALCIRNAMWFFLPTRRYTEGWYKFGVNLAAIMVFTSIVTIFKEQDLMVSVSPNFKVLCIDYIHEDADSWTEALWRMSTISAYLQILSLSMFLLADHLGPLLIGLRYRLALMCLSWSIWMVKEAYGDDCVVTNRTSFGGSEITKQSYQLKTPMGTIDWELECEGTTVIHRRTSGATKAEKNDWMTEREEFLRWKHWAQAYGGADTLYTQENTVKFSVSA